MSLIHHLRRRAATFTLNTLNTLVYLLSGGTRVLHEGRYFPRLRLWAEWSWRKRLAARPQLFLQPRTEEELCRAIRSASQVRVVGGGYSFNSGTSSQQLLLSLDRYNSVLEVQGARVRVQAGIRLRDLTQALWERGLALPLLGSADTQSMGGVLATDVHGSGREHGFISEQVRSLRLIDSQGQARTVRPGDEAFHAAIGGIGTCGVISEVELECVPAFYLFKASSLVRRKDIPALLPQWLERSEHVSFYHLGGVGVEHAILNTWRRDGTLADTHVAPRAWRMRLQKLSSELFDMFFSGYVLGFSRSVKKNRLLTELGLRLFQAAYQGKSALRPASTGFSRKLYYRHDEIEYGVPFESHHACVEEMHRLLERLGLVSIIEVRFTPPERSPALLGHGAGRRTCYVELAPSLYYEEETVQHLFREAEQILLRHGGRPHLGKATYVDSRTLARVYREQERFARFQAVRLQQDPTGKFLNAFARALFEPARPERHDLEPWLLRHEPATA